MKNFIRTSSVLALGLAAVFAMTPQAKAQSGFGFNVRLGRFQLGIFEYGGNRGFYQPGFVGSPVPAAPIYNRGPVVVPGAGYPAGGPGFAGYPPIRRHCHAGIRGGYRQPWQRFGAYNRRIFPH